MAAITDSFVEDIQRAFMDELSRAMEYGVAEDYPTPDYLQLRKIIRGNPTQPSHVETTDTPTVVVTYYGRLPGESFLGGGGIRQDEWVFWIADHYTPTIMGMSSPYTEEEFRRAAHASMDELMERIYFVIEQYNLSVESTSWNWVVSAHFMGRTNAYYNYIDPYKMTAYGFIEVTVSSER